MGYCVTADIGNIVFSIGNSKKALNAINAMHTEAAMPRNGAVQDSSGRHYSWVNYPKGGFETLEEALHEWRYSTYTARDTGAVMVESFEGEKLGDDEVLWAVLAEFVTPCEHATITWRGEDGHMWRYQIADGKLHEQTATVIWE